MRPKHSSSRYKVLAGVVLALAVMPAPALAQDDGTTGPTNPRAPSLQAPERPHTSTTATQVPDPAAMKPPSEQRRAMTEERCLAVTAC